MKSNYQSRIIGFLFVVGGVLFLGDQLGYWEFSVFFPGWWTVFLILPAIFSMVESGVQMGNGVLLLVGCGLLIQANGWLGIRLSFGMIVALIFILLGVRMVFGRHGHRERSNHSKHMETKNVRNIHSNVICGSRSFRAAGVINSLDVQCMMGTSWIDLSEADVRNMEFVNLNCVMGTIDLIVPSDMNYVVKKDNVLGSCEIQDEPIGRYDLYVDISCVLGQVNLRKKKVENVKEGEFKEKR
ncbi:LiaF transmembrane domain-containing protein [Amedibacillus sp. YH-ame6]